MIRSGTESSSDSFLSAVSDLLDQNVWSVEEGQPYQCQDCVKAFKTKMNLQRHQTVHTGEKPYQCEVCDQRFTQQQSLNAHRV